MGFQRICKVSLDKPLPLNLFPDCEIQGDGEPEKDEIKKKKKK
jgi:hypothetical protein